MRRRLLERLEQRVERRVGEHVHLVDEVHLVARAVRRVAGRLAQGAHLVDATVRGGVELDQVERTAALECLARDALVARLALDGRAAVDGLREDAAGARLAGAARSGEQIGVRRRATRDRIAQRGGDRLLAHHVGEPLRPPLPVQDFLAHVHPTARGEVGRRPASVHARSGTLTTSRCTPACPGVGRPLQRSSRSEGAHDPCSLEQDGRAPVSLAALTGGCGCPPRGRSGSWGPGGLPRGHACAGRRRDSRGRSRAGAAARGRRRAASSSAGEIQPPTTWRYTIGTETAMSPR